MANYTDKRMAQLIEEILSLKQRINELELSLEVFQKESVQKRDLLETSRDYLQTVIDNIYDPTLVIDREYRIVFANKMVKEMAGGIDPVKAGLFCYKVSHHNDKPCIGRKDPCPLRKILKTRSPVTVTHTHYDSANNKILVEIVASPILDRTGEVAYMIESCRDISERMRMERELYESEMRYRSLFEQSSDAILMLEAEGPGAGNIMSANKAACKMHGYTEKEMLRLSLFDLATPEFAGKAAGSIRRLLAGGSLQMEVMHRKKDGTVFPVDVSSTLVKTGEKNMILVIDRDISERRRMEEERKMLIKELERISETDGLTGLLNRQRLDKRLNEEINRANRYREPLSLIMFDIDNFKKINDTFGHVVGDKVLQESAVIVKETIRITDLAGRFGGDEFVLILVETKMDVGLQVAERLRAAIEQAKIPLKKNRTVGFTISAGICQYDRRMKSARDFISRADKALYEAKKTGHNRVCKA